MILPTFVGAWLRRNFPRRWRILPSAASQHFVIEESDKNRRATPPAQGVEVERLRSAMLNATFVPEGCTVKSCALNFPLPWDREAAVKAVLAALSADPGEKK